ncbi:MAG: hypothetical protein H7831_09920 [Magnetococcus sp. WYHC-3]
MKLTITKIFVTDKDKHGNPLTGKNGPYSKKAIKATEYGDKWISGFAGEWNKDWKVGDVVEAEVEDTGKYLNLKAPASARFQGVTRQEFNQAIKDVHRLIDGLQAQINALDGVDDPKLWNDAGDNPAVDPNELAQLAEINPDDVPF